MDFWGGLYTVSRFHGNDHICDCLSSNQLSVFILQLCVCKLREVSAKVFVLKKIRQLDLGKQDTAEGIAEAKLLCTLFHSVTSPRDIVFCGFAEGYMGLRFILQYKKLNKIKNKTGASCHKHCISVTIRHWGNEK